MQRQTKWLAFALSALAIGVVSSCARSHTRELQVELVTGLVAGPEFTIIETTLLGTPSTESGAWVAYETVEARAHFGIAYQDGHPIAHFDLADGAYRVQVRLRQANGELVAEQSAFVVITSSYILRVHVTRDCVAVECPGAGSPELVACLRGRCVDSRCDVDHPEYCPEIAFCHDTSECGPTSACAQMQCIDGECVEKPIEGACDALEWCNPSPSQGCVPLLQSGGVDCGTICALESERCRFGYWDCSSATPVCRALTNRPAGTVCGPAETCDLVGECTACPDGAECRVGCELGSISCASGSPDCVLDMPANVLPEGADCRDTGICIDGTSCVNNGMCDARGVCRTPGNFPGVIVEPSTSVTTNESGASTELSFRLATQPDSDVTMTLTTSDPTEGTVAPDTLVFTPVDWNGTHNVTVVGVDDSIADGPVEYTLQMLLRSDDPDYELFPIADLVVLNEDNDTAGISVTPSTGLTTSEDGTNATFNVQLNTMPTADVTIALLTSDASEGVPSPSSLTFTSESWNTPQPVLVTGVDDFLTDGPVTYVVRTEPAASEDASYAGMDASDVALTNSDNDMASIVVTPSAGLTTTESGGTAAFSVRLSTIPSANVILDIASMDTSEGSVSPVSLSFTPATYDASQIVTITGIDDALADGAQPFTVRVTPNASSDPEYAALAPISVAVTNTDNDTASVLVTPSSGLSTTEAGGSAMFTLVLSSQPTSDVTISLASNDTSEGTVAPASVTFTNANWNTPRSVTVTGVNDSTDDGNVAFAITTGAAVSSDPNYSGLTVADVSVTNIDDDTAGVTVTPTSGLITTEGATAASFTIVLTSRPTANVSIALTSSDTSEGTVSPASITFTTMNWNTPRTITVTGVNDAVDDGNVAYSIVTGNATSTDPSYNGFNVADVSVSNTDDDMIGITVTPTSGLTTTEAGGTATFTVVLLSQPTANVSIALTSSDTTEGTVSPASLTFTTMNWNTPRVVTITGANDSVDDGNIAYTIVTGNATSSDGSYNGFVVADVSVTTTDDDTAAVVVTPTSGLVTTELGGIAMFTVVLSAQPSANVTVSFSSSDSTEGSLSTSSVTFTSANWSIAQIINVIGEDDFVDDGNQAYTIVTSAATSADSGYSGLGVADVSVSNTDNDTAGIEVTPSTMLTTSESGADASFSIRLSSQPLADVTVALSSSDATEGSVLPTSVTFTSMDWGVARIIVVTGLPDGVVDSDIAYSIVTAAAVSTDPSYSGMNAADVSALNLNIDVIPPFTQQAYAKASNTSGGMQFGGSVSLSADGNTMAVAAVNERSGATGINGNEMDTSSAFTGAVYVLVRSAGVWTQQAYIKASNAQSGDRFGSSVSLSSDGNTLAVGGYNEGSSAPGIGGNQADNSAAASGAVYVFTRTGTTWSQQEYIKASSPGAADFFGGIVSISGDGNTLVVGAYGEDSNATGIDGNQADNSANGAGAVYVFVRAGTVWSQQAYIKASNTEAFESFGETLDLSADGNTLAVTSRVEDSNAIGINGNQADNSANGAGAAYVFVRSAGVWSQQAYVKASNTQANDQFGRSIALSSDGNTLAVGAPYESSGASGVNGNEADNSVVGAGAAYVLTRSGSTWTQQAYLKASNPRASAFFGWQMDLAHDGNSLVVTAYQEPSNATGVNGNQADASMLGAGAGYAFTRSGSTWSQIAFLKASNTGGDNFGWSVAISGDGTNIAIGARNESSNATGINGNESDNSASGAGAVYFFVPPP